MLFLSNGYCFAQSLNSTLFQTMSCLYDMDYGCADSIMQQTDSAARPNQYNFMKAHYIRWKQLPIHEAAQSVTENYSRYLVRTNESNNTKIDSLITVNNALLEAEYHYNNKSYYKAFSSGAVIYNTIAPKISKPIQEVNIDWLLPVSLYHYYYSYYSESNVVIGGLMWFFKDGDKKEGLTGLAKLAASDNFAQTEALIYLSQIYLRIENKPEIAFKYATQLITKHPDNLKFYEFYIEAACATGNKPPIIQDLIIKLLSDTNPYFNKYGICYETLIDPKASEATIELSLSAIDDLGGGNHLKSLLYKKAYLLNRKKYYLDLLKRSRNYEYKLTLIADN